MYKSLIFKGIIIVVACALAGTLLLLLVNYVQTRQRDVERLNDVRIIRLALESYFFNRQAYPAAAEVLTLGAAGNRVLCDSDMGLHDTAQDCGSIFLPVVPRDPLSAQGWQYAYASNGETYNLTFQLESSDSGLAAGVHTATPDGIN